jgi:hypothetical protein
LVSVLISEHDKRSSPPITCDVRAVDDFLHARCAVTDRDAVLCVACDLRVDPGALLLPP